MVPTVPLVPCKSQQAMTSKLDWKDIYTSFVVGTCSVVFDQLVISVICHTQQRAGAQLLDVLADPALMNKNCSHLNALQIM